MAEKLTYKPYGSKAILIEWQTIIDNSILKDILLFKEKISKTKSNKFTDIIIGYNSLTVVFKNYISSFNDEVSMLKNIYLFTLKESKQKFYKWEIPVCYDLDFGIDLQEISKKLNLTVQEIINIHSEKLYRIHFIGFLPGFLYLGGLHKQIYFDRRPNPRLKVPKGAVGIGGKQTGIYPIDSAGGWNIIGKTPLSFFNVDKDNPCFANPGDFIKFTPITIEKYYQLEKEIKEEKYQFIKTLEDA